MQGLLPNEPRTCKNALCGLGFWFVGFIFFCDIGTVLDFTDEYKILIFFNDQGMASIKFRFLLSSLCQSVGCAYNEIPVEVTVGNPRGRNLAKENSKKKIPEG